MSINNTLLSWVQKFQLGTSVRKMKLEILTCAKFDCFAVSFKLGGCDVN